MEILTDRSKNLYARMLQALFKIKYNIKIGEKTALSLKHLGTPSEVLNFYSIYKKKYINNPTLSISLLRIDSLINMYNIKQSNDRGFFKYFTIKYYKTRRKIKNLKKTIIKETNNFKKGYKNKQKTSNKCSVESEKKIDNFRFKSLINSIKKINEDIYKLAEVDNKKAFDLSKTLNNNIKKIMNIYLKNQQQNNS